MGAHFVVDQLHSTFTQKDNMLFFSALLLKRAVEEALNRYLKRCLSKEGLDSTPADTLSLGFGR